MSQFKKNEIKFASIDAKEIGILSIDFDYPKTEGNYRLMRDAETEYLRGLAELQETIAAKYNPQLEDQTKIKDCYEDRWSWEERYPQVDRFDYLYYT